MPNSPFVKRLRWALNYGAGFAPVSFFSISAHPSAISLLINIHSNLKILINFDILFQGSITACQRVMSRDY